MRCCTLINELPERRKNRILKTKLPLPDHYMVNDVGMILPECFVDHKLVESIFRHPSRLMFALAKKVETETEMASVKNSQNAPDYPEI